MRRAAVLLAAVALPVLLGGCSGGSDDGPAPQPTEAVDVPLPGGAVDPVVTSACEALVAALPEEVDPGVTRRPVRGDGTRTAAWGEPPVRLTCGVPLPERLSEPVTVNGVVWNVRDAGASFLWTTTDRAVNVSVDIPETYENPAEIVNPIATEVLEVIPTPEPGAGP